MKFTFVFIFSLIPFLFFSQEIKIEGNIKQPTNEKIKAFIVVNDTIEKLEKIDSTNFERRNKIYKENKLVSINDDEGNFTIYSFKNE